MRLGLPILILLIMSQFTLAQVDDSRTAKVQAARANAANSLQRQINSTKITPTLSVRDFVKQAGGQAILQRTLDGAEQIGGPRWIDDRICQVRLEISGVRVGNTLVEIANNTPALSPLSPGQLQVEVNEWKHRTFSATGVSFTLDDAGPLGPAMTAARASAINSAITRIQGVKLPSGRTIGEDMNEELRRQLAEWLNGRPIAEAEISEDRKLTLTLSVKGESLTETVKRLIAPQLDPALFAPVAAEIERRAEPVTGTASLGPPQQSTQTWRPADPPAWVNDQLTAEGFSRPKESKLRTARAAEADATTRLREKLLALPIGKNLSLRQAAESDPALMRAIDRALLRSRVLKTEYNPDGSAAVQAVLSLGDAWEVLSAPNR